MLNLDEEKEAQARGYKYVGGIDEAGRGPLAGPVVAVCAAGLLKLPEDGRLELINDSKKLSARNREEALGLIKEIFAEIGIGICEQDTIDRINILQASFLAMKKAIGGLKKRPDFVLLDGKFKIPNLSIEQKAIIRGDSLVFSIAAASIVAKVTRDRIMDGWDEQYPLYGFKKHKGYGTKLHLESLAEHGPCPIHRRSFSPVKGLG